MTRDELTGFSVSRDKLFPFRRDVVKNPEVNDPQALPPATRSELFTPFQPSIDFP